MAFRKTKPMPNEQVERNARIAQLFKDGRTCQEIGDAQTPKISAARAHEIATRELAREKQIDEGREVHA